MKRTLDRTFALQSLLHNKKFFLLSAGAAPEEQYMQIMLGSYRQYIFCFEGNEDGGYVMAYGMNAPTDVKGTEYIQQAYEMGKSI